MTLWIVDGSGFWCNLARRRLALKTPKQWLCSSVGLAELGLEQAKMVISVEQMIFIVKHHLMNQEVIVIIDYGGRYHRI